MPLIRDFKGRNVELIGIERLQRSLERKSLELVERTAIPVLKSEATRIMTIAANDVSVGVTGQLRKNIRVLPSKVTGRTRLFSGRTMPTDIETGFIFKQTYAVFHHEGFPKSGGDTWPNGGKRKYAENAIRNNLSRFHLAVGRAIGSGLG